MRLKTDYMCKKLSWQFLWGEKMDNTFVIRRAREEDAGSIKSIINEAFQKYKNDAGIEGNMEALDESIEDIKKAIKNSYVFIALFNDIPVGTIRVTINSDNTAYISRFGVRLKYHNIGIGKSMITLVDKFLISKGVKTAYLYTASTYRELVRFYYGRGFYIDSTTKDKGYIRALMVKKYQLCDKKD